MSDFEDRLRRALHEYVAEPGPVEITDRIEARIRQRQLRKRRAGWGAFGVGLAALLVIGLVAFIGGSSPTVHLNTSPAPILGQVASPVVPPAPGSTGVDVLDLTWISPSDGWLLGTPQTCTQPDCPALILTTNDGGQTWHEAPAPALTCSQAGANLCPTSDIGGIRFATTHVGYLYGGVDGNKFFSTTDGGLTWVEQSGTQVLGLEAMDATAIRVVDAGTGCPGPCRVQVEEAPIGTSSWNVVLSKVNVAGRLSGVQLARQSGGNVYLAAYGDPAAGSGDQHAALYVSHDGGATWRDEADPCAGIDAGAANAGAAKTEVDAVNMASAPNGTVAVDCAARDGSGKAFVVVSTDAGQTFGPPQVAPVGEAFSVASPTSLFLTAGNTLEASFDGGAHWSAVATDPTASSLGSAFPSPQSSQVARFLGFESATTGRWVDQDQTVWTTTDGGHTWSPHAVSS